MDKNIKKREKDSYSAKAAMNMIDSSYNSHDYPIVEKTQNAYVMPLDMQRDVDSIDGARFYTETNEVTQELGIEGIPASPEARKNTKKFK